MKLWQYAVKLDTDGEPLFSCGEIEVNDEDATKLNFDKPNRMDYHTDKVIAFIFKNKKDYENFGTGFSFGRHYEEWLDEMEVSFEDYLEGIANEQK